MAKSKLEARLGRKESIRRNMEGTAERPRLSVFRSAKHIYAQVVDDAHHKTLVHASTLDEDIRPELKTLKKVDEARRVGTKIAEKCLKNKIEAVVFDRNGYIYHGRVSALADAARKAGLKF
jgi:large subunit ribosomal protein L18